MPVKKWWMKPLAFMARCQRVSWDNQWLVGVRLFDVRVRFDNEDGLAILCHGLIEYEGSIYDTLKEMDRLAETSQSDIYVRIVLEQSKPTDREKYLFLNLCKFVELTYTHLRSFGGNDRTDWLCEHPIYQFTTPMQDLDNQYASATTRFPKGKRWLRYIDDLYPLDYAKRYNHKIIEKGTSHEWLMLDFVDIR